MEPPRSARRREPLQGLRQKVRQALRMAGFPGKFSVQIMRGPPEYLLVQCKSGQSERPVLTFEGRDIWYQGSAS